MSTPHLPAELLDHVVDYLHDTKHALRNCCLVSKSWIPRTRTHLFANVLFRHEQDLESWRETFPDPSTSPARYTETLRVHCLHIATAADAKPGGWIRGFSRVVHLKLSSYDGLEVSLLPFHGFSPVIKSLYVGFDVFPSSPIFDLILSFPLLEDLTVHTHRAETNDGDGPDGFPTTIRPPNPPMFTGSLELAIPGVTSITRQLVSLPSGIHFRKFTVTWDREADILPITALVERCSHTLESLSISCESFGVSIRRLHPYPYLTLVPSRVNRTRSLEGDKTPRCGFSAHIAKRRVDHHGNPNNHTQTSRPSEDLDSRCLLPDLLRC